METVSESESLCLLERKEPDPRKCGKSCAGCGWNRKVAAKRAALRRKKGLEKGQDGLYRVVLE